VLALVKQSKQDRVPDLFCAGLVGNFRGYFPGLREINRRAAELFELDHFKGAHP
jgi:hypothetical protein